MINIKLKEIQTPHFADAYNIIKKLCENKVKLSLEDIKFILNLNDKELVAVFFSEYSLFDQDDFIIIEKFINDNL